MKFTIRSAGAVASRVTIGNHDVLFDQADPKFSGEDRGPSPLEAMVASVGACAHYYAAAFLTARKIDPSALTVEVSAEKAKDPSPHLGRVELEVHLPEGLRPEYIRSIERVIRQCPALGTLLHPPEVTLQILAASESAA
jgi:uncharacterized OsmC-like protein